LFSIEEISDMLDEAAAQLPSEVFDKLNGGVSLLPNTVQNNNDPDGGLYTLGEYRYDQMGRYIYIYYGSICAVYPYITADHMRQRLKDLLAHELTHHLESLAGERDLEIQDAIEMDKYLRDKGLR